MSKLLAAGFARLKKDKMFWIGIAFMVLMGIFVPVRDYLEAKETGFTAPFDSYFFVYTLFTVAIAAIFSSLFLGTEYSDGTMRNKIVVGHSRSAIYFSNLIVNIAASLLTTIAFIIIVCAVGIPLFGPLTLGAKAVVLLLLASVLMIVAFAAIFTCIGMLIQNKTIVAIVSILGVLALFMGAITVDQKLREPEFYEYFEYGGVGMSGEPTEDTEGLQLMPNPNYLQPNEREVYQFFYDFNPAGQAMQISQRTALNLWQMQLYSLLIIVTTTAGGVFFFRRKDLK